MWYAEMNSSVKFSLWILISMVYAVSDSCEALRILGLFPVPSKSHFSMDVRLMRTLAERGHQVDLFSHFPPDKRLTTPPNYRHYWFTNESVQSLFNPIPHDFFRTDQPGSIAGIDFSMVPRSLNMFGNPGCGLIEKVPELLKIARSPPVDPPYDLVILEETMSSCYYAFGRRLKVPIVTIVPAPHVYDWMNEPFGIPTNPATDSSLWFSKFTPATFSDRLSNFLISNYISFTYNWFVQQQDELVERIFGPGYPSVVDLIKDTSLVLVNHHHALNGIRPFPPGVVPVGGLHITVEGDELSEEVQKFLDHGENGFIYMSFGTMARIETFPREFIQIFYESFEKIAPVRVLMRIENPQDLPSGLPSNVLTQPWLPQLQVLRHRNIKAFITHGGLLGSQEAIYHGVPMIGFPIMFDQFFNLDSYEQRNIAIKLDYRNLTEPTLTQALLNILNNPTYRKSAELMKNKFKDTLMSPLDTAVFWVEYVTRHGKHCLRAPVVDLPWWQACLLDIYGFMGAIIFIMFLIIRMTCKIFAKIFLTNVSKHKLKKN